jgi:hypothetical protein
LDSYGSQQAFCSVKLFSPIDRMSSISTYTGNSEYILW